MRILNMVISISLLLSLPINTAKTKKLSETQKREFPTLREEMEQVQMERNQRRRVTCGPNTIKIITQLGEVAIKGGITILTFVLRSVLK